MTTNTGNTAYYIDEFGIGLAITCVFGRPLSWFKKSTPLPRRTASPIRCYIGR